MRLTGDGHLYVYVNHEYKGALFTKLPVESSLWAIIDIYGTTRSITFIIDGKKTRVLYTTLFQTEKNSKNTCTQQRSWTEET